ncbi:MAG: S8 family serine peptidase [Roseivirga sp.]|nr:S8 family serine peptidase [Roseivirga sp.]
MRNFLIAALILVCLGQQDSFAQTAADRAYIKANTNVSQLRAMAKRLQEAQSPVTLRQFDSVIVHKNGQKAFLSGIDKNGNPVYDHDDNFSAAITSGIDKIWRGSTFDLSGCDIQIGHWEAGGVALAGHREFGGRVSHAESAEVTSHATHTAGTMIGEGVSNGARGMAPCATIVSRRSNNDVTEMSLFAAEGGILSSHSYSRGNPDGNIPEYGQYNADSRELDELLFNAPYLSVSKSASNTRDDGVNEDDQGYDILFTRATSKNLIVVGGVDDVSNYTGPEDVHFYASSSWGPTDDWRIKPDLSANAVEVFSANNTANDAYDTKSGTSMSTPVVTGAIALLQEYYHNQNSVYMKAATVKALLLNTTRELGEHDGPDFQNGWGLLNAEKAANVIMANTSGTAIRELNLVQDDTYTTTIQADGTSSFSLTIAWTDPAGTISVGADSQVPVLVNDLDVRISGNGETYEPWVLTPNSTSDNFTAAALKGDNFRDNVERIDIDQLPAGTYTVTVTHKETLTNGMQDFSMVMSTGEVRIVTSVEERPSLNTISLYPNPSNGTLTLSVPDNISAPSYQVTIVDLQGRTVYSGKFKEKEMTLNTSRMKSGIYITVVKAGSQTFQKRLIIER